MKLTDIQQELLRLFDEQDASTGGAIVVWHDPDGEFTETINELELPGIEVLREHENALFKLKRALNEELSGRRILLYRTRARRLENDWLADVETRSAQFAADYTATQLRVLNAAETDEMRAALTAHKTALAKKAVIRKLQKLSASYDGPQQLERALMAAALDAPTAEPDHILRAFLLRAYSSDGMQAKETLDKLTCAEGFDAAVRAWTGYTGDTTDFLGLLRHILLSAASLSLPASALETFTPGYSHEHAAFCHGLVSGWARSANRDALRELCELIENDSAIERALNAIHSAELAACDTLPCIDALLLKRMFAAAANDPCNAAELLALSASRRNGVWYEHFAPFYEGLDAALHMRRYEADHPGAFDLAAPERVWKAYTESHARMDTWYRHMHVALSRALSLGSYGLDEDFRACCSRIEDLYKNWFLRGINHAWMLASEGDFARQGYAQGIPRQIDFFMSFVEPAMRAGKRTCVIASDALRYEVATELADALERLTKGTCELASTQAMFPSITKCGMAALLPAGKLSLAATPDKDRLDVLVDGRPVPTCSSRQEVLRKANASAVAVQYETFFADMGRAERKELVQDASLVYIYHNAIDAQGDKPATEKKTFAACDTAINELCSLVALITRENIASRIVITADHGFLYTDEPLDECEHALAADVSGGIVEAGRRYVIARAGAESEALQRIALTGAGSSPADAEDRLVGFTPRGTVRIRRSGGGENYVHGGLSLQELCVPVLTFTNKRAGSKGYVETRMAELSLVTTIDTVSNSLFTLEFLQDEPVGGKVLPARYEIFVGDATRRPVTDEARIVADRTEEDAAARTMRVSLSLKPGAQTSEQETYHLYVRNCDTGAIASLRELRIRVAFAPSIDFGW